MKAFLSIGPKYGI